MEELLHWKQGSNEIYPLRAVMLTSLNGAVHGHDGTSASLSFAADRQFFLALRRSADLIIVGAQTVRQEHYKLPSHSAIAVMTRSGVFPSPLFHDLHTGHIDASKVFIITDDSSSFDQRLHQLLGSNIIVSSEPKDFIAALRHRGFKKILCEGGPTILQYLMKAGVIEEIALTLQGTMVELHTNTKMLNLEAHYELKKVHSKENALFTLWHVKK